MPREQFVEPSTGSITTVIVAPRRSCTPDSSLTMRTGSFSQHGERGVVGDQVERVLAGDLVARSRRTIGSIAATASRTAARGLVEAVEQRLGRHRTGTTSTTAL